MKYLLIILIRFYQLLISPLIGGSLRCRFRPTCSEYAIESLQNFGFIKGSLLMIKRLLKCHKYSKCSGYDPVPDKEKSTKV